MNAITIDHLSKRYGKIVAVDDLSLQIKKGELFGLLGVNGAGKTTLIKMLTGLTSLDSGDAVVGGHSIVKEMVQVKRLIGVSPQESALAPNLTVRENMELICGIYGFSKKDTKEKVQTLTDLLHLQDVLYRKAHKLSGGWQRRVSIAMALISSPQILFLDEPTLGLDVISRQELWDLVCRLKGNMTIILTTHYMEEAQSLCDRIGIMKNGHLLAVGTAAELMQRGRSDNFEKAFVNLVREDVR